MCGRFTSMYTWEELVRLYRLTEPYMIRNLQPRYNICPTTMVDVVTELEGKRQIEQLRWGLIPGWWSKPLKEMKIATFNARAETVEQKPMFRTAFKKNRCIIPASGYYEWQHIEGDKKPQPWYFTQKNSPIVSIAGIWDEWKDRTTGELIRSCSMIITEPNKFVAEVHDRMPVILQLEQFDGWLSGELGKEVLVPANDNLLQRWMVDKKVNSSRAEDDDAGLIAGLTD